MEGHAHMPSISLQDIVDAADKKYGPFVIEGIEGGDVTLLAPVRLPKDKRDQLKALDDKKNDKVDEGVRLGNIIRLAATDEAAAERLLAACGDDLGKLAVLIEEWTKASQVGEASPSRR